MENRCVCCGEIVPEGRWVCPQCEMGEVDRTNSTEKRNEPDTKLAIKKTQILVTELRILANIQHNDYYREVLNEAAQRLYDTDKIAEFYRQKAELIGGDQTGRKRREKRRTHV